MNRLSGSHQQMHGGQPHPSQQRSQSSYGNAVPIPTTQSNGGSRERNSSIMSQQQYDMGKSPPSNVPNKNTKHVPCKFFRQGQCQAGNACPFLHTMDPMSHAAPCKYFMKGNCKFGAKCALAHYLPNGHRVSKADLEPIQPRRYGLNGHEDHAQYTSSEAPLYEPFIGPPSTNGFPDIPFLDDDYDPTPDRPNGWQQNGRTSFEGNHLGSPPNSQFGSPPNDPFSPHRKWPSALNAPLPASYNNSLPNYAKYGPLGASVPDKFGLGSPPNAAATQAIGSPPMKDAVQRTSQQPAVMKTTPLGASPAHADSSIGQRIMHSQRNALRQTGPMSASVPVRDLDDRFGNFESDLPFLPSDLHDEVLTPGEKMRRVSRAEHEPVGSFKDNSEGLAIPRRTSNVVGSPPAAGSPSRFRAIFEEQQKEKMPGVGVVGSPLRESLLADGNSSISNRQSMQMSGISQAMARMEIGRTESSESTNLRPAGLRGGYARQISSPGLTSKRIDEEGEGVFFPMDDESTRRSNPAWIENQAAVSRRVSEEQSRGVGFSNNNRPIFGFNQ